MLTTYTPTDDDDALAERLADLWVEAAQHDPFLRLAARQAAGLVPEPGSITASQLAAELPPGLASRLYRSASDKARLHPELRAAAAALNLKF